MTMSEQTSEKQAASGTGRRPSPGTEPTAPEDAPVEPSTPPAPTGRRALMTGDRARLLGSRYALLVVWAVMAGIFGGIKPHLFFTVSAGQGIFGSQSALLLLAVAALCTFVVGEFDLSFAGVMGLSATMVPVLATEHHMNLGLACFLAVLAAVGCGLINAFFIVKLGVPSLIVTLGTASLFLGIAEQISDSNTLNVSSPTFNRVAQNHLLGLPLSFYYGLGACVVFAYVIAWTPLGRHVIFVGANREVARLAGINVDRIRAASYIVAALIAGLAGVVLVASIGGFEASSETSYLLPALAAVFLGTAIVRPGQFNPMGTFLGIYFLETGIYGLQLLGYSGWVVDAFYGAGLVLAVTAAQLIRSRTRTA
jgi:ribose transport system permease protein